MLRTENVVVPKSGRRDDGKIFRITEKDAVTAEKWGWRMVIALKGTAMIDIPDELARLGMVGLAIRGMQAFFSTNYKFEDFEPLLDEMLTCVQIVRDPSHPDIAQTLLAGDIEEVSTVTWLRSEVFRVHTGFSFADGLSTLLEQMRAQGSSAESTSQSM